MQFNQPFYNTCMNEQHNTYPAPFQCANIVGEGDVTSLLSPDGSVQWFFVPLSVRDKRLFYPYSPLYPGNPIPWPIGPEAWLIRRISHPIIPSFTQDSLMNRDPFLKSYFASKMNTEILPPSGYYQKFHNDNVTSTTDIHYFYPKLRHSNVKYSTSVQVEIPPKCQKSTQYEPMSKCSGPISNIKLVRNIKNVRNYANTTDSAMSIDENTHPSRKKDMSVSFQHHKRQHHRKQYSERQACTCNSKNKTDKKIATCMDKSCSCMDEDGRETQTDVETVSRSLSKSLLSDVNTATSCESCCQSCEQCDDSSTESDVDK